MTTFDFRAFLEVAEDLSVREDPAYQRTALSRAYYAIFGAAWHALPSHLQTHAGRGRVHQETWTRYAASAHQPCRQIGGAGMRLRLLRHEADYQASATFTVAQIRQALLDARSALRLLEQHGYQP